MLGIEFPDKFSNLLYKPVKHKTTGNIGTITDIHLDDNGNITHYTLESSRNGSKLHQLRKKVMAKNYEVINGKT